MNSIIICSKKYFFLTFLIIFINHNCLSQNYQTVEDLDVICSDLGYIGDQEAEITVDRILDQIGLFKNFTIQECPNINNAIAKNIDMGNGETDRYILYDKDFFNRIKNSAVNDWAAISILAHEIGHHLNGHALNNEGSNHKWELEADEFSGFVLARMGALLEDAQSAINTITYEKATRTHPAKADRLKVIQIGWQRGRTGKVAVDIISEDEKKQVQEITVNNSDELNITPQQILATCIEALGGETAITNVKTIEL